MEQETETMANDLSPSHDSASSYLSATTQVPSNPASQAVPDVQHSRIPDFSSMAGFSRTKAGEGDTVMRTLISNDGDTMRLLQQSSRHHKDKETYENGDKPDRIIHPRTYPRPVGPLISELATPSCEILRLWNSLRFVRMGWLTAREAVTYIDL